MFKAGNTTFSVADNADNIIEGINQGADLAVGWAQLTGDSRREHSEEVEECAGDQHQDVRLHLDTNFYCVAGYRRGCRGWHLEAVGGTM